MSLHRRRVAACAALAALTTALTPVAARSATAADPDHYNVKTPTSTGFGGAVTSVDPEASRIGVQVLREGGNAVDAAVATAAALGVTEPYSSGIGGGGYFVYRDGATGKVSTLDGRETAPQSMPQDAFVDPATHTFYRFTPELVTQQDGADYSIVDGYKNAQSRSPGCTPERTGRPLLRFACAID